MEKKYPIRKYGKKQGISTKKLDFDEKRLLSSFEKDEWKTVPNLKKEKLRAQKIAAKTLRKDVQINL